MADDEDTISKESVDKIREAGIQIVHILDSFVIDGDDTENLMLLLGSLLGTTAMQTNNGVRFIMDVCTTALRTLALEKKSEFTEAAKATADE